MTTTRFWGGGVSVVCRGRAIIFVARYSREFRPISKTGREASGVGCVRCHDRSNQSFDPLRAIVSKLRKIGGFLSRFDRWVYECC